jgi:hypothetical protein
MARRRVSRKSVKALKVKAHKTRVARAKDVHVGRRTGTHVHTVNAPKTW